MARAWMPAVALAVFCALPSPCPAETPRRLLALPEISSANAALDLRPSIAMTSALEARPATLAWRHSPLDDDDRLYRDYLGLSDDRLQREYHDRWLFHDLQGDEDGSRWGDKHVNIGSLEFYNDAPTERDARKSFAERTLRLRIETTVRASLRRVAPVRAMQRAEKALRVQQATLSLSDSGEEGTELKIAYSLFTDQSRFELVNPRWRIGFYHSVLRTFGGGSYAQAAFFPARRMLTPSATYRLDSSCVEVAISKELSPRMTTSLTAINPTRDNGNAASLGLSFRYEF